MIIYKTTNLINSKIYIGKSSTNDINYLGSGILLKNAIRKYGKENFKKEILEEFIDESIVNDREIYWINYFNATHKDIGYNLTDGGDGGNTRKHYSTIDLENYYKKLSRSMLESTTYRKSVETRTGKKRPDHSDTMKSRYASGDHPWSKKKGTPLTKEVAKKISEANKGKKRSAETKTKIAKSKFKPVLMLDQDGKTIQEFESIKHAFEVTGIGRDSIYGCCIGKYMLGGGYKWKYN